MITVCIVMHTEMYTCIVYALGMHVLCMQCIHVHIMD